MRASIPGIAPTLKGGLVDLVQIDESCTADYTTLLSDPGVKFWTATDIEFSKEQISHWLRTRVGKVDRLDWAVCITNSSDFVGELVLNELDEVEKGMNLRIALLPEASGKGYGTEAVQLACRYAFEQLQLDKVTLEVLAENYRAIASYEKAGFVRFAEFKEGPRSFLNMGLTRSN